MKLHLLVISAFLALLAFKRVDGINCLQCVGVGYTDCGGVIGNEKKMDALPCLDPEHKWCFTMREDDHSSRLTSYAYERGCSKESLGNFCNVGDIMSTCYSSCSSDGCNRDNSATGLQMSALTVLVTVAVAYFLH